MHWTLELICRDCGAVLRYTDERPEWQGTGDDRFVACPSCEGHAGMPRPGLDLGLDKAFGMFRSKARV